MYVVLIIRCIFLQGISAISVAGYSNSFTSLATEHALDDVNPTAGSRPTPVRNLVDKIDVKDLIETLQNTFRRPKSRVPVAEPTILPNLIRKSQKSKHEDSEDSSKNLVTELEILDTAYAKVSDDLQLVHGAIQKNFDVMMKLNILKGMLMEESIRSKGSRPWIEYISKYKI